MTLCLFFFISVVRVGLINSANRVLEGQANGSLYQKMATGLELNLLKKLHHYFY